MAFGAGLVDPRLLGVLALFFPSACTVQSVAVSSNSYGEVIETWSNVSGMVGVGCRIVPATQSEPKNTELGYAIATHTAVLKGNYAIDATMRAVIDSVTYDITGVGYDDQAVQTRLDLRRVDP